jgi:hypothetical protein
MLSSLLLLKQFNLPSLIQPSKQRLKYIRLISNTKNAFKLRWCLQVDVDY